MFVKFWQIVHSTLYRIEKILYYIIILDILPVVEACMENKITFSRSFQNMKNLIKQSKGVFLYTLILALIPVLIINCYTFFILYDGFTVDYNALSALSNIDFSDKDVTAKLMEVIEGIVPAVAQETSFGDEVLSAINMLITLFLDAFLITLGVQLAFNKKYDLMQLSKQAIPKMVPILIINLIISYAIYELQQLIYVSVVLLFSSVSMGEPIFIYSMITMAVSYVALALFVGGFITLFYSYMAITVVSSRARAILAFGYSREILKGKTFKQFFHILPFVAGGFILPMILQAVAIGCNNTVLGIILTAINVILQIGITGLLWFYLIPDYFELEKNSGVQEKLRKMFEQAVQMQFDKEKMQSANGQQDLEEKQEETSQNTESNNEDNKAGENEQDYTPEA